MRLVIKVTPNAKQKKITLEPSGRWRLWVQAPAVDGKANQAVIELLAAHFHIHKREIRIVAGLTQREKTIELPDLPLPHQSQLF